MTHTEYLHHRQSMRDALGILKRLACYERLADGTDFFQRQREEATYQPIAQLYGYHYYFVYNAGNADPLGFRDMYREWQSRRLRVEYACRRKRQDAERKIRHDARYGVQS